MIHAPPSPPSKYRFSQHRSLSLFWSWSDGEDDIVKTRSSFCLPFFLPSFLPPMGCTFSGLNALYDVVNGGSADVWINETRFRIVRTLGEGGFSSVYLVREQPGGRPGKQITNPSFTNGNQFVSILTASHILSS